MMAYISVGTEETSIEKAMIKGEVQGIEKLRGKRGTKAADVFLNGRLVGVHPAPQVLVKTLRQKRRAEASGRRDRQRNQHRIL
jgi:DNA-directed RNA polymerase subunit B